MRVVGLHRVDRDGERGKRGSDGGGQEVLAPVDPYERRKTTDRSVRAVAVARQGDPERGQDRVPGGLVRGDCRSGDRVRRAVDEPGHPGEDQLTVEFDLDRDMLVIALPARVAPLPRPAQVDIVATTCPLTARQCRPLSRVQVPADRSVQRRQRRHLSHQTRDVGLRTGCGPCLGQQLPVYRGGVPTPPHQPGVDILGDGEMFPLAGVGAALLPGCGQPPPHRPQGHPRPRSDETGMLRSQLAPGLKCQQTRHRLPAGQPDGNRPPGTASPPPPVPCDVLPSISAPSPSACPSTGRLPPPSSPVPQSGDITIRIPLTPPGPSR